MYEHSRNGIRWYAIEASALRQYMTAAGYDVDNAMHLLQAGMELGGPITTLGVYIRYRED